MEVGVIGAGYVGLVTAIGLASFGHHVQCADISQSKIDSLRNGTLPMWEQGLEELFKRVQDEKRINFTAHIDEVIQNSTVLIIAVGTPSLPHGEADLSQIWSVIKQIPKPKRVQVVVIKSTVPVGTCDRIAGYFQENDIPILDVIHNPEFLRQGNAVHDFFHPDRIVVGTTSHEARIFMKHLFEDFAVPIQFCDRRSAELIKYASNAFLAMKISYINMIAELSDRLGANVEEVAKGMGTDKRIGYDFLNAGAGYGGSCFPKDIKALLVMADRMGCKLPLLEATEKVNDVQPKQITDKVKQVLGTLKGRKIALFGLAFKPLTDDIREAPSLKISQLLLSEGARVHAYDPLIKEIPIDGVHVDGSLKQALKGAHAAILLTEWDEFHDLNWDQTLPSMHVPFIVDGRNLYSLNQMKALARRRELIYLSVGRPQVVSAQFGSEHH